MTITAAPLLEGSILDRQIATETDAVHQGVLRYRRLAELAIERGHGGQLKAAERLIGHWHRVVSVAIDDEIRRWDAGEYREGSHIAIPVIRQVGCDELSYIALNTIMGQCLQYAGGSLSMTSLLFDVGGAVLGEIHLRMLREHDDREVFRELTKRVRVLCPRNVNWWARRSLDDAETSMRTRLQIGAMLVRIAMDTCTCAGWEEKHEPAFRTWEIRKPGSRRVVKVVGLTTKARRIIDEGHEARETLRPRYLPMLVQPYPWTDKGDGGYVRIRTPFISKPTREQKDALAKADLTRIRDGLTAVSGTPWRINRRILDVAERLFAEGGGSIMIPLAEPRPIPPRPDFGTCGEAEKKRWRTEARRLHVANEAEQGLRSDFLSRVAVARRFVDDGRIWFPHQFDFRSRCYPIPVWLNHQGGDLSRGLLEFADDPGTADERALAIHAANTFGLDKVPFQSRVDWAANEVSRIRDCAERPLDCRWWMEADKPWQFLAACMALNDPDAGRHLPVQVDGTCNGLQHYAAMTRDAAGGALVNLLDSETPQDVYAEVARAVADRLDRQIAAGDARGLVLQGRVDRKLVKRVVMTSVYGVTEHGATSHIAEAIQELFPSMEWEELLALSIHVAKLAMSSLGEVCHGAKMAMDWIREHASRAVHADRHATLRWETPLGFPVVQPYRRWRQSQVVTLVGTMTIVHADEPSHPVMLSKQVNGSAPNFVHGLDASHMLMTATRCAREGMAFAGVHDSFWTHSATVGRLGEIIRETFIALHEQPALDDLADQWRRTYGIAVDSPPRVGTFTVPDVARSRYFFS